MENFAGLDITDSESESNLRNSGLLPRLNSDMRFVGMFYIIYGVFVSLSIIGAIIGIPCIIMGLRLRDAAKGLDAYQNSQSPKALYFAFDKQRSFFNIQKIIIVIMIVFMILYFIGIFFFLSNGGLDNIMNRSNDFEALGKAGFLAGLRG